MRLEKSESPLCIKLERAESASSMGLGEAFPYSDIFLKLADKTVSR